MGWDGEGGCGVGFFFWGGGWWGGGGDHTVGCQCTCILGPD